MSTDDEDTETIPLDPVFLNFRKYKVMISHAIKKPFPFLEVLRDNNLITEKMYTVSGVCYMLTLKQAPD